MFLVLKKSLYIEKKIFDIYDCNYMIKYLLEAPFL